MYDYDWLVIGSGPAGEKGAAQAAYFGKRVALVEKAAHVGGACIHTGTLPSKTLRETAVYLSGFQKRELYGSAHLTLGHQVSLADLMCRQAAVIDTQAERLRQNLEQHKVDFLRGEARFVDEHTVDIVGADVHDRVTADAILIAVGSSPFRPSYVPFEDPDVDDSDSILRLPTIPKQMVILGGGVIGCEYASIFAALGTQVTIVEGRDQILGFLDHEINERLTAQLQKLGCRLVLKKEVIDVGRKNGKLVCSLDDGSDLECERLLFAGGRSGNTQRLLLERIGARPDGRGLIHCDEHYRVLGARGRVYAAGDVIGFPALASVAMEQGRVAACHAFDLGYKTSVAPEFPYGLYTIPEVGTIGHSEESAKKAGIDYEVGRAHYRDQARGQIIGDLDGMVKLVFSAVDKKLLGVHVIGERATELVHIGQAVMHFSATIDHFIEQVFNFPSLGELYKYAAYDGLGRLGSRAQRANTNG